MARLGKAPDFPMREVLEAITGVQIDLLGSTPWGRKIRCPIHGADRHPSAAINHANTAFKCMTCDISGDTLKILMEVEGLEFTDALARAKELTGIEGSEVRGGAKHIDPCDLLLVE